MSCPLPPPDPPVQFRTPSPQSNPKKHHQSSPVKPVVQHFAEHKRDEVQAFGYDEGIHQVKDFKTHEDFFNFLRVSEEAIKKHSGKVSKMVDEKASKASDFSRENFVQAANTLAKSIKDDCFANVPLLVFKSTESKTPRGHITDTECRPDFTAAFDIHWGGEATTLWPCIRLAGEDASAGKSKKYQENQAVSYLHYLLLARPDLHVAQGLLISMKRIMFLFGIGGRGIYRLSADWTNPQLNRLMFAFFYRLYDPGHFGDATYVAMVPNFQNDFVEYTIRISIKTQVDGVETNEGLDCHGFSPIYATSPFGSRTHILSNPLSDICVDGKVVTVVKDQLSRPDPRFDEYTILNNHVHSPEKVPGVVEAVCHELVEISESLGVTRVKHRMGLRQSGSPIMSIQTLRGMLEVVFDVLEVLRYLRVERQVLHRDISRGNVLYIPEGATPAPDDGETKEASLYFIKFLLGESTIPQKTSALLIDFNNAEHLESRQGGKRSPRTGTPVFIARAVQQGNAVLPPKLGLVPAVPSSPEPYTCRHPDRIKKFPLEEEKVVRRFSPHNVDRQWRHELDHDAESVFWLFLYWLVLAQPGQSLKEVIKMSTWSMLTGTVSSRTALLRSLSEDESLEELTHSIYQPLFPLLSKLAAILVVERHWLDESETRNDPEYVPEAFQRLILQFILDNRDKEFMTKQVDPQPRQVEGVGQNPNLLSTASSRRDENRRKRPSPRPSKQRQKRRRLAAEKVAKEASDSEDEDTDKEQDSEEEQSEYEEDDEEMASDSE